MDAKPLKKELYEKAIELGVDCVSLEFSGGSDEGYLYVQADHGWEANWNTQEELKEHRKKVHMFESDVEEWAWTVYEYSGAGDGTSYGDTITYDLNNQTMSSQEWYHAVQKGEEYHDTLVTR
tara:strand:- start:114 stop:479 length:366 start_codon:yes stop_codon:yes gene_type:complete